MHVMSNQVNSTRLLNYCVGVLETRDLDAEPIVLQNIIMSAMISQTKKLCETKHLPESVGLVWGESVITSAHMNARLASVPGIGR
jgi:hypothetical protein